MSSDPASLCASPSHALPITPAAETRTHAWKDGAFGFHDLLDVINPLQHVPVVGAIYRWMTGDVPGNVAQLAGDALYGGPIGFAAGLVGIAFKKETGKDPGAMAIALLGGTSDTAVLAAPAEIPAPAEPMEPMLLADGSANAAASVAPAHPPMPLVKARTAALVAAVTTSAAARAFLMESAARHHDLTGQRPTVAAGERPVTALIPLKLTGQAMQLTPLHMPRTAAAPSTVGAAQTPAPDTPLAHDISQRMQDALDKYRRLEQSRGGTVDLHQ
jgi:hypothetical protein